MAEKDFELKDNRLTVRRNLDAGAEDDLQQLCGRLLEHPAHDLVIDLSAVEYLHSLSVGVLSYAWVEALNREKELSFIASQAVADVFERTGLNRVFTFELKGK